MYSPNKQELVDVDVMLTRSGEEIEMLLDEMRNVLSYYENRVNSIECATREYFQLGNRGACALLLQLPYNLVFKRSWDLGTYYVLGACLLLVFKRNSN